MPDILHRVGVKSSSANAACKALTAMAGRCGGSTNNTHGESKAGEVAQFRFGAHAGFDMKGLELDPASRVLRQVVGGSEEWIGLGADWLGDLDSNQGCPGQSREFYR